ncbi:MAG: DMT family transporter [Clostridia bacterium]|nr:DMT family transporter [Clostridia bacterium]
MNTILKKSIGVLLIIGAAACFALMNLFVNLAGELPLMQKVFFRNALTMVVVFFILLFSKEKFRIHGKQSVLWLFLRSAFGFIGIILNFYAIDHIGSISDASILNKLSPFFAILFSIFLLKEKPTVPEIIFTLIAFAGAVCVVNPRFDMQVLPAVAGVCSGACAGFAYTCVRILFLKGERGIMTVFFFSAFSTVIALPFMIAYYVPISGMQWLYLMLAGVSATGGQFFITAAYRQAPAKEIAVFDYFQVLFAALLGFFFLSQVPATLSMIGYAIIIGAAVGKQIFHFIGVRRKKASKLPAETDSVSEEDGMQQDEQVNTKKKSDENEEKQE